MKELIKNIIAEQLDISPDIIDEDSDIIDIYGANSLDAVDLLIRFEEHFNFSIPEKDAIELRTVRKILNYIEENK